MFLFSFKKNGALVEYYHFCKESTLNYIIVTTRITRDSMSTQTDTLCIDANSHYSRLSADLLHTVIVFLFNQLQKALSTLVHSIGMINKGEVAQTTASYFSHYALKGVFGFTPTESRGIVRLYSMTILLFTFFDNKLSTVTFRTERKI